MARSNFSRQSEVLIVNALDVDIVTDKILEHLPIRVAARASVLSKQWRRSWLSLKKLEFVERFWSERDVDSSSNRQNVSKIISSILLHHDGPVHYFELQYENADKDCVDYNFWLPFLSKHGVGTVSIDNFSGHMDNMSSYIFYCSDLVRLQLYGFTLNSPPASFSGYRNLKHLELFNVCFGQENVFSRLVENCSTLALLQLEHCKGLGRVVINAPSLKTLMIFDCESESIDFRNVCCLESILIPDATNLIGFENLARSSQLQSINLDGEQCKLLAASLPVTFNFLNKLCLCNLDLSCPGVYRCVLGIIESCPYIKLLDISVASDKHADEGTELDYNFSCKLSNLLEVQFINMKGSRPELRLIEYLFFISPVLDKLSFMPSWSLVIKLELEMLRNLMMFPRASPKAQLICLEKSL